MNFLSPPCFRYSRIARLNYSHKKYARAHFAPPLTLSLGHGEQGSYWLGLIYIQIGCEGQLVRSFFSLNRRSSMIWKLCLRVFSYRKC